MALVKSEAGPRLLVMAMPRVVEPRPGQVSMTRKFYDGILEYVRLWPGPVTVMAQRGTDQGDSLDGIDAKQSELPFDLKIVNFANLKNEFEAIRPAVVMATAGFGQDHVAAVCRQLGIPCVYVSENTLRTRIQIADANTSGWLKRTYRRLWEGRLERRLVAAVTLAQGVQCNGTPTYAAYRDINPNPLLFFDTRVARQMLITPPELETRLHTLLQGKPLRLLFSGRLVPIKGADQLLSVATHLKKLAVPFELTICGDGSLSGSMRTGIESQGLTKEVRMLGVLDFRTQLIPMVKRDIDLFVCCHRQGDPSCTYLETMSCGVPIVGYDNEAFAGLTAICRAGWTAPMNRPDRVAEIIAELSVDRPAIAAASRKAMAFAHEHAFETEFERRVSHLAEIAKVQPTAARSATA